MKLGAIQSEFKGLFNNKRKAQMASTKLEADVIQYPVGQGGFLIGRVLRRDATGSREFTYGYDCGSVNREHFEQGLDACSLSRLDVLFISHLDLDHVSGIDALAAKVQIDAIVLPCLDALQTIALACEGIDDAGVRGSFAEFLIDPVRWFGVRRIKKVYFVRRDLGADGQPIAPIPPDRLPTVEPERGQNDQGRLPYRITANEISEPVVVRIPGAAAAEHSSLDGGIELRVNGGVDPSGVPFPDWLLIPYVHPFSTVSLNAFLRALAGVMRRIPGDTDLAPKTFTRRLLALLRNEESRRTLKACYSILSSDNNRPSMSLYSGSAEPLRASDEVQVWQGNAPHWLRFQPPGARSGWLSTGDADLNSLQTRTPWLHRYEALFATVAVFVLPHHGSNRHIHDDVIKEVQASVMVACAATGRNYHPHPALTQRLRSLRRRLHQVSEQPDSDISLHVTISR
jgi:hypothetical protein